MVNWGELKRKVKGTQTVTYNLGNPASYEDGLKEMDKETSDTAKKNQEKAEETRRLAAEKKAQQEKVDKVALEEAPQDKLKEEARERAERLEEWEKAQERARIKLAAILLLIQHLEDEARASARESEAASRRQNIGRNLLDDIQDARPKERNSGAATRELAELWEKKKQAEKALRSPKPW